MILSEAAKTAHFLGQALTRHYWRQKWYLFPTNTISGFIICRRAENGDFIDLATRWEPSLEDVIADDWLVEKNRNALLITPPKTDEQGQDVVR